MVAESDADEIQRDRAHRQAAQRRIIDSERRRRRAEVSRLEAFSEGRPAPVPEPRPEPEEIDPSPAAVHPPPAPAGGVPVGPSTATADGAASTPNRPDGLGAPSRPRAIGAAILSDALRAFLEVDPAERFDLTTLNRMRLSGLVREAGGDRTLLAALARRASDLMVRAKQETDDPLAAGAFLREQLLDWYRHSPNDPTWSARAVANWAGLFADSRISGGKLHPWLNVRLGALRSDAQRAGRLPERLRRGFLRDRRQERLLSRSPSQQIQAEVAQALLDDLAARPRDPEAPAPLVRLSELAVRRQIATVNEALSVLFGSPESGPFVVLHPNRYPDCDELALRPPQPGATGAALAYTLAPGRPNRRGAVRLSLSADGVSVAGPSAEAGNSDPDAEADAASIWESATAGRATWVRVVDERRRERRRLDPPPRDFRTRPAWTPLKELILEDGEFRKALLAAKWRGRPTGLPLLVALLQKGRLAPEVATDHEYLEAELEEWAEGGAPGANAEGVWAIGPWTVRRESTAGGDRTYRAERAEPRPPPRP